MLNSLSAAATGMAGQQEQLNVISNNLANADTTAFKGSRAEFQDLLYQNVKSPGAATSATTQNPTGVQIGAGSKVVGTQREHSQGILKQTERELDVAIEGEGYIAIQKPDGEIAYTRDGSLRMGSTRRLESADGFPVVPEITIPQEASGINITPDGKVQIRVVSNTGIQMQDVGQLQLTVFANNAGLQALGGNLYSVSPASGTPTPIEPGTGGAGRFHQKHLEGSNVNPVQEMTSMIRAQRVYELNSKVISAADQMLGTLGQIR